MSGGFKFAKSQSQGDVTGMQFLYEVDAAHSTALVSGDVIRITGTANSSTGVPEADAASASESITGVMSGSQPTFAGEALSNASLAATTAGSILVNIDTHALYEVDVSNGPLAVTTVGLNANTVATSATTSGGITTSNMTVNATGVATTSTLPWRIVALREDSDGVLGNVAIVRVNNSTMNDGATGV